MSSIGVAFISVGCLLSGLFLGLFLGDWLPEHHLNDRSKDAIKLASIFLFDEMVSPLDGIIKVPSGPIEKVLDHLGR